MERWKDGESGRDFLKLRFSLRRKEPFWALQLFGGRYHFCVFAPSVHQGYGAFGRERLRVPIRRRLITA
jgi:hypothetical protein